MVEDDYVKGANTYKALYEPLTKLCDHINLEIARYQYSLTDIQRAKDIEKSNEILSNQLTMARNDLVDAKNEVAKVTENLNNTKSELSQANEKLKTIQTEVVSVLSIFAAIVLTFAGGISYIGEALRGMKDAPFFKAVFFVLLCGFVIFNLIFVMMYIVSRITGRSILAKCCSDDCSCRKKSDKCKCCGIVRFARRLPYVFWLEVLYIVLMVLDIFVWCHAHEWRLWIW